MKTSHIGVYFAHGKFIMQICKDIEVTLFSYRDIQLNFNLKKLDQADFFSVGRNSCHINAVIYGGFLKEEEV